MWKIVFIRRQLLIIPRRTHYNGVMSTARYVQWQDGDMWLGYLQEFPDYMTQGETRAELLENLVDLYHDLVIDPIV